MTRPEKLSDIVAPAPLRDLPFWLCWKLEQFNGEAKARKVPYYPWGERRHGTQGAPQDMAKLTTFAAARDAAMKCGMEGVGFAHTTGAGVVTLDFDNCVTDGKVRQDVFELVNMTYAEFSPSGNGIHAIFFGDPEILENRKAGNQGPEFAVEAFSSAGFTTFTGRILEHVVGYEDRVAPLPQAVVEACQRRFGASRTAVDSDDFMLGRERPLGFSIEKIEDILRYISPDCSRDQWIKIGTAIHHETEGDDTGLSIWDEWSSDGVTYPGPEGVEYQWRSFRGPTPGRASITMASVIWMAKEAGYCDTEGDITSSVDGNIFWLDPVPLPDALLAVPNLEEDMLPSELQPWLGDIAARMSVPLDFTGSAGLSMLGALIGRKIVIKPEKNSNWSEPANLWGCIVASPGALKSPAIREVFAPLAELEAEAMVANKQKHKDYELAMAVHKVKQASAEKKAKDAGDPAALMQAYMAIGDPPEKPKFKRYFTSNATVEKLGEMCADNPDGVMYHRDELLSLLADLDRKEKAADRGFLMTGWSGLDAYTFDRIGRGTTYVPSVTISMFGTTQPSRIANYVSGSLASFDDGMVQRLQILVWPDNMPNWVPMDSPSDKSAQARAFQMCRRLAEFRPQDVGAIIEDGNAVPYLRFTEEARRLFVEYRTGLEAKVRGNSLLPELAAHLSKYRGLVPRIALILHLASGGTGSVSAEAITMAIRWADYLEAHARRVYAAAEAAPVDTAKLVWKRIENAKLKCGFTVRDIYTQGWSQLKDKAEVERGLGALVHAHWLAMRPEETGGRPIVRYYINPKTGNLTT